MFIKQIQKAFILGLSITLIACGNESHNSSSSDVSMKNNTTTNVGNIVSSKHQITSDNFLANTSQLSNVVLDDSIDQNDVEIQDYNAAYQDTDRSKYVYTASGNKIAMFRVESGGGLHEFSTISSGISAATISSLAVTATNKFVYATIKNGSNDDKIFMLRIDHNTGALTPLTESMLSTGKTGTSSMITSKDSKFAYVANSTDICSYAIESRSGILSKTPYTCISPTSKDKDNKDVVQPYAQLALSPNGKYILVSSGPSLNTIITLKRNPDGGLSYLSQLNTGVNYNLSMAIPSITGRFIYTALKGNGAVGQYSLESNSGIVKPLTPQTITTGSSDAEPHAVAITLNQKYVYAVNYHKNTIAQFKIDASGKLQSIGTAINASGGPDKILVNPGFVYIATANKHILQYQINQDTGLLTPLQTSSINLSESISQMVMASVINNHKYVMQTSPHVIYESEVATLVFDESHVNMASVSKDNIKLCELKSQSANEYTTQGDSSCIVHDITLLWVAYNTVKVISNDPLGASKYLNLIISNVKDIFGSTEETKTFNEVTSETDEYTMIEPPAPYTNVSPNIQDIVIQFKDPINPVSISDVHITKQSTLNCCPVDGEMHIESEGDCNDCPVEDAPVETVASVAESRIIHAINVHLRLTVGAPPIGYNMRVIASITYGHLGSMIAQTARPAFLTSTIESAETRKLKIYVAGSREGGYAASLGLETFDALCDGPDRPFEEDGTQGHYLALLGSRYMSYLDPYHLGPTIERIPPNNRDIEGINWVLYENRNYYNRFNQPLGTTNEYSIFPDNFGRAMLISPIDPSTSDPVWTALDNSRIFTHDAIIKAWEATDSCNQWRTTASDKATIYGMPDATNSTAFYNREDYNPKKCSENHLIYCAQQW